MLTNDRIWTKTHWAKNYLQDYYNQVEKFKTDPEKKKRLDSSECKFCFYTGRVGGSAITKSKCKHCLKELSFCNTNIDDLCLGCAKELGVCKHCSADVSLKIKRKGWL